jgi:hypothetical protein
MSALIGSSTISQKCGPDLALRSIDTVLKTARPAKNAIAEGSHSPLHSTNDAFGSGEVNATMTRVQHIKMPRKITLRLADFDMLRNRPTSSGSTRIKAVSVSRFRRAMTFGREYARSKTATTILMADPRQRPVATDQKAVLPAASDTLAIKSDARERMFNTTYRGSHNRGIAQVTRKSKHQ